MKTLAKLQSECAALGIQVSTEGRASKVPYLAALRDHFWQKDHPGEPLPDQVMPMLLGDWNDLAPDQAADIEQDHHAWIAQPKLDGVRALVHIENRGVLRKLHGLGIRWPVRTSRSGKVRGGKLFTKQQVIGILRNSLYIGRIEWGEAFKDDCHEALVSKERFERVQRVLGKTTKHRGNQQDSRGRCYLLRGLVRCGCGAQMTPAGAHGHGGKYHYYVCTRQVHEGGKVSCQAPRFPAAALEIAVLERIRILAAMEEARDRIVQEALKVIAEESTRVQGEEEILRRQLARVRGDIGRLVGVLKTLGASALTSVQEELSRLEQEERGLDEQLQAVSKRKDPLDKISSQARQFLETWKNVGQLLDQADAEEQRLILQHYVEVIELRATDKKGRAGT